MNKKKPKINLLKKGERASVSDFIIDLRTSVNIIIPEKKNNARHIAKKVEKKFEKKIKIAFSSPNLLITENDKRRLNVYWSNFKDFINSRAVRKKIRINIFSKRSHRHWINNYQKKLDEFNAVINQSAKNLEKKFKSRWMPFSRLKLLERKLLFYRSVWSFLLILVLITVPFKALSYWQLFNFDKLEKKIVSASQIAFNSLMAAGGAAERLDFSEAQIEFQKAAVSFIEAESELDKIGEMILFFTSLSSDPKLKLASEGKKFVQIGMRAAFLGEKLSIASDSLFKDDGRNLSEKLDTFIVFGDLAVNEAVFLSEGLKKIKVENLPAEYRQKFLDLSRQAELIASSLKYFISSVEKFQKILGISEDKRYLLVFQNNAELRASGGFLGSYALVDIRDGKIRNLEIPGGGSYDTEGGMSQKIIAPQPLWLVSTRWHFWDANWWPDWTKTAKNLMWFYEKSGGPTVDGVISLTPSVIEDLLKITGPVDLQAEYGLTVEADNFWEVVQMTVEKENLQNTHPEIAINFKNNVDKIETNWPLEQGLDLNSANKPKKIIGDLTVKILDILPNKLNKENLIQIISLLEKNLSAKQILFYFNDESLQAEFSSRNWAGEIRKTDGDYLAVIHTNIAGQKTDRKMSEEIEHISAINEEGEIINTLKITRTHHGYKNEPLYGVRNVDWLRIYVPLGSELLSADGFIAPDEKYLQDRPEPDWLEHDLLKIENLAQIDITSGTRIYEDSGKTVLANWLMVDPGESRTIVLKYKLPFNFFKQSKITPWGKIQEKFFPDIKTSFKHSLLVQKQPGSLNSYFVSSLLVPPDLEVAWSHPDDIKNKSGWDIKSDLNADKYWSVLIR